MDEVQKTTVLNGICHQQNPSELSSDIVRWGSLNVEECAVTFDS